MSHPGHAREPGHASGEGRGGPLRQLAVHPVTLIVLAWMLLIGGCTAGGLGVACAALSAIVLAVTASRSRTLSRWLDQYAALEERRRRTRERLARLERTCRERQEQFKELNRLVEQLEDTSGAAVQIAVLDLQGLLDRYVRLAAAHACLIEAGERGDQRIPSTWLDVVSNGADEATCALRREVLARRSRHKQDCWRRAVELSLKLEAIVEFVLLVHQRAASEPIDDLLEDELGWRLHDLDAQEAAQRCLLA